MFSVSDKVIHNEGMDQVKERLLDVTERIKTPTDRNRVVSGEDGMGCIGFHEPEITSQLKPGKISLILSLTVVTQAEGIPLRLPSEQGDVSHRTRKRNDRCLRNC
jgi:hypothetical protein